MLNFLLHFWNRYFREPFDKQHGKRAQALLKSASQHVYYIHWSVASQLTWKKSLLLTCKILGLLFNTLATDEKYALLQKDNLTIPIQMQLSQKLRSFSQFFAAFLKYRLNFNKFQTKYEPQIFCLSEIRASENVVRKMSKKSRFRGPFGKQHVKRAQALLKSASEHLYHIQWSVQDDWAGTVVSYWHGKS